MHNIYIKGLCIFTSTKTILSNDSDTNNIFGTLQTNFNKNVFYTKHKLGNCLYHSSFC